MAYEPPKSVPRAGEWVRQMAGPEPVYAFMPAPLPPDPPLRIDGPLQVLHEQAGRAMGRLDGVATLLPSPDLFLYTYVRKEAVLSSQIEGTQSSLSDLLLFEMKEAPGVPTADVQEVSNYVSAMHHGLRRLKGDFPLCLRLLKEIHGRLMKSVRGGDKQPGEFRTSQNWIGGSRPGNAIYVPPPHTDLPAALGNLEKYLHSATPTLIKAGVAHAQFESIHPFLDGNGRLGRLLITFILCAEEALSQPLLYLSLYFKANRGAYYDALQRVRTEGDWEAWLEFYLRGVDEVSRQGADTIHRILRLFERHRQHVQGLGKAAASALRLHDLFKQRVYLNLPTAEKELGLSFPTVSSAMSRLEALGIVRERTGHKKDRVFCYDPYLKILAEGMQEPAG